MKKSLILFVLLAAAWFNSFAQNEFKEGYVITNKKDTVMGWIKASGNASSSKQCVFKKSASSEEVKYLPEEILAFRFSDGKYYVAKNLIKSEQKPNIFMEFLLKGKLNVYYFKDETFQDRYFIEKDTTGLIELKVVDKEILVDKKTYIKKDKKFIGVLKFYLKESAKSIKNAESTELTNKSLIKLAKEYHKDLCPNEECLIFEKHAPKVVYNYGVLVGINSMNLSTSSKIIDEYSYFSNFNKATKVYPSVGLWVTRNLPVIDQKLWVSYDVSFAKRNFNSSVTYSDAPSSNNTITESLEFSQIVFNQTLAIGYEVLSKKIKTIISLGVFYDMLKTTSFERKYVSLFPWGTVYRDLQYNVNPFNNSDYGFSLGVGNSFVLLGKKRISVDLKYQKGFGMLSSGVNHFVMANKYLVEIKIPFKNI